MKIQDDDILDFQIFIVKNWNYSTLLCYGNEDNAYSYAIRENFKLIENNKNQYNKDIFEKLESIDSNTNADFKEKLEIIWNNWQRLIVDSDDFYKLLQVEEYIMDTNDIYI